MPIKKSELYSSLWKSCDELRGGMDASQYKDYVLVLLFVKYVSDKAASQKGYLLDVPKGGSFADMVAAKNDKEIGEKLMIIVEKLAKANDLSVITETDFNDDSKLGKGKEMVDRLTNLVGIFESLDFAANRAEGDDLLGDAYEYLMRHFATESGKSKGQFYTPAEVSRIMAQVIGVGSAKRSNQTIHDPTCGSGSLLLKAHDEAKSRTGLDLTLYGQEKDNATTALAKMNMILHGCTTAAPDIWNGNTLTSPHFTAENGRLKTFDFVVANPPFSDKAWSNGLKPDDDDFKRFEFGIPPKKNGDYAFLLHILACLKSTGKGAVILPHGVLFRGNAEAEIRKNIIRRGYIKGIIGLPANLFYGTGIPACIIVLDKENASARKGIFMIDASKGFIKDGNKNRLREQDIHKIVDTFNRQAKIDKYSEMVSVAKIEAHDFNLNIPRYIDSTEPEDLQDIDGHLRGGIPNRDIDDLARYWDVFPAVRASLFKRADRTRYCQLRIPAADIKTVIYGHDEFTTFNQSVTALFAKWKRANTPQLKDLAIGSHPKELIETLSENLLATFAKVKLIDPYDVYQHLMSYWADVMQDDVYMIASDGWQESAKLRLIVEGSKKNGKEKADITIGKKKYKAELIPPALVVARYFAEEKAAIDDLEAEVAVIEQKLVEMKDEHGGEEGLLCEVIDEKGSITKGAVAKRLKDIKNDPDFEDEHNILTQYIDTLEEESEANEKVKEAQKELDEKVVAKYGKLTDNEIKTLVVDDKWLAAIAADVESELDRVSQSLTGRVRQLADRYSTPLPKLSESVETLCSRVSQHLQAMGAVWN